MKEGYSNLGGVLHRRADTRPDGLAYMFLRDSDDAELRLSYGGLHERALRAATLLRERAGAGDRALLFFQPGLEYVTAFFACLYAGVTAVPAYPPRMNRSLDRLRGMAADAGAKVILATREIRDMVRARLDDIPEFRESAWITPEEWDAVSAPAPDPAWLDDALRSSGLAFLQYTSGSTASPKGVRVTHANILHNMGQIAASLAAHPGSLGCVWLPPYHDMGLIGGLLQPVSTGFPVILMSPAAFLQRPIRWLRAIGKYGCTISGGPDFAYDLCVRKIPDAQLAGLDLRTWRTAFNGAEPIRPAVLDAFADRFAPYGFRREAFYPCYGLAETTLFAAGGEPGEGAILRSFDAEALSEGRAEAPSPSPESDAAEGVRTLVACGRAWHGQSLRIVDPASSERVPDGRVGEIWVSGESIADGYWNRPQESERIFRARIAGEPGRAYLRTGDLGFLHEGRLFITGRIKDLLIIRGKNHYPQDLEQSLLDAHPALVSGATAATGYARGGEEGVLIFQELDRAARHGDPEPVFTAIRRRLTEECDLAVSGIVLLKTGSIPRTSSGKIQRHACAQGFETGTLEVISQWMKP